jgi:hypothetical protein
MRKRLRELGFSIGRFPVGPANAITDVAGVRVGHTTLILGDGPLEVGKGPVRTGVTAIVPNADVFENRVVAGGFVLNGAGEVSGITQVSEWGLLETPILLTNTMAVGKVSDAAVKWMTKKWPKNGGEDDVVIPLVGSTTRWGGTSARSTSTGPSSRPPAARSPRGRSAPAPGSSPAISRQGSGPARAGWPSRGTSTPSASWSSRTSG